MGNEDRILIGISEEKKLLEESRHRCKDNIKITHKYGVRK
jgi:hypothetical protein